MKTKANSLKIFITLLFISAFSITSYSQEHLRFRNVPIDGNVDSMVEKLVGVGYIMDESNHIDRAILHGKYGYKEDAVIRVKASCKSKVTSIIVVEMHKDMFVSIAASGYDTYFDDLKKKFGSPQSKIRDVFSGSASAFWIIKNADGDTLGMVNLHTYNFDFRGNCKGIEVEFRDRQNDAIYSKESKEDDGL